MIGHDKDLELAESDSPDESLTAEELIGVWKRSVQVAATHCKYHLVLAAIIAVVTSACDLMQPVVLGRAISVATSASPGPYELLSQFVLMGILQLLKSATEFGREKVNNSLGDFVRQYVQKQYFSNILDNEKTFFDLHHTSEINKGYTDLNELHYLAGRQIPGILKGLLTLFLTTVYMLFQNLSVGMLVVSLMLCQAAIERRMDMSVRTAWLKLQDIEKATERFREEGYVNIRTVKHFSSEQKQKMAFARLLEKDEVRRRELVNIWAFRQGTANFLLGAVVCVVWITGLPKVQR